MCPFGRRIYQPYALLALAPSASPRPQGRRKIAQNKRSGALRTRLDHPGSPWGWLKHGLHPRTVKPSRLNFFATPSFHSQKTRSNFADEFTDKRTIKNESQDHHYLTR